MKAIEEMEEPGVDGKVILGRVLHEQILMVWFMKCSDRGLLQMR